jgi:hypothetical protein
MCVQPCFAFVGEQFESDADFRLAKSMLLDLFRGRLVENINLKVGLRSFNASYTSLICNVIARG